MPRAPDVYDRLKTTQVNELTVDNLDSSTKESFIEASNVKLWSQSITLNRIIQSSRTYPWGLEIPETGAIETVVVAAGENTALQPTGTEIWRIKSIYAVAVGGTATVTVAYTDGTLVVPIKEGASVAITGTIFDLNEATSVPFTISNPLYLKFFETGSTNAVNFFVVYYKVSL